MREEWNNIKIWKNVKVRLDMLKKNCTYSEFLESMIAYFEITGIEPKSGQIPPAQSIINAIDSNAAITNKRIEDLIKILRNIENTKIDPIFDGIGALVGGIEFDTSSLGDENLEKMVNTIDSLKKQINEKDHKIMILQKEKEKYFNNTVDVIRTIEELLSNQILEQDSRNNYLLLSPEHRDQLITKIKTISHVQ